MNQELTATPAPAEHPQPVAQPLRPSRELEVLGHLAEGMVEDFSDYLTVIQGHSALLLADPNLPPEARAALAYIYTAGGRAANLVRQLQAYSRPPEMRGPTVKLNELAGDRARQPGCLAGEDAAPPPPAAETTAQPTRPPRGSETLLVVEDEAALRELAVLVLQRCGYRVLEAASGTEALKVWARHQSRIQLLFTDLVLPDDLDGWELAETLQAEKPGLEVIYTSSYSPDMLGQVFVAKGPFHFLQKPYHTTQLAETVRRVLDETNS